MTYKQRIDEAGKAGIYIPEELLSVKIFVGIYKFFYCKENEEHCFYIGKSTDVAGRLLGSNGGHIYMYLKGDFSKLVPFKIKEYRDEGYNIKVEIMEVNYHDTKFSRAAHRLALVEIQEIVKYQEKEECLFQIPEGVGENEEKFWEANYKK